MAQRFQAEIYSVKRPYYHGMELPPGGLREACIPEDIATRKATLYGVIIGAEGSECVYPKGYEGFKSLEISDFMTWDEVHRWVEATAKQLKLPQMPRELPDLVESESKVA